MTEAFFLNFYFLWSQIGLVLLYLLPLPLAYICWQLYLLYIRLDYLTKLEWVLLEIKIPREVLKSPQAMEVALSGLHQPTEGNLIDRYIKGRVRSWFSLELASLGGAVHFFIRTEKKFKDLVEAQIYSQYPEVEIYEVDDYAQFVPYGQPEANWSMFGVEFQLTKADAYPIRTYIDYGLDKDPKEEFKIDPITPVMELLGSLSPAEQLWIQIPITATRDRFHKPDTWFGKQGWQDEGKAIVNEMIKKKKPPSSEDRPVSEYSGIQFLTPGETDTIKAIERSIGKLAFDAGIRMIYLAPADKFQGITIPRMLSSMKQFSSASLNGFKPLRLTGFEYPWQDPWGTRLALLKRRMFEAYRRRGYFYWPYAQKPMVLNTEELATIYHFPGQVAETPTLSRIDSRRGEPPPNLPVMGTV